MGVRRTSQETTTENNFQIGKSFSTVEGALAALIDAIDFEGSGGCIRFNPGTPYEDERLTAARIALAALSPPPPSQ